MIAGVPYDAEIEYLESTGTQYIDTGLPLTSADTIRASFARLPTTGRYDVIFGARHSITGRNISCGIYPFSATTASLFCDFSDGDDYNQYRCIAATNATGDYRVELSAGSCRIEYPGGTAIRTVRNEGEFTTSENCRIFSGGGFPNKFWSGATNFRGRFYSFGIERGGVLVRDYQPVRVGNVGYLYDRVSRKLFGNRGEGSFVLGPDVATPVMGIHRYAPTPTVYDCTMDGLVTMWDGICNVSGKEHEATPSMWKDLTGNGHDFIATPDGSTLSFSENAFIADGTKSLVVTLPNEVALSEGTVEVVFHMPHRQGRAVYETLMCLSAGGFRIAAPTDSTEVMSRGLTIRGGTRASAFSTLHVQQPMSYALLFDSVGVSETYCNGQYLGTFTPSVGFQNTTPGLIPLSYLDATFDGSIYAVRIYSRHLSAAEIEHNHELDRKRFNLPA